MAKKIANKTENAALQGATVLAAQTVAVSPLAVQPAVAAAAVELQKAKKKAVDADQEQQATVVDSEVLSDLVADQGAVQGADIVLAQASGSGSGGAAGGAAGGVPGRPGEIGRDGDGEGCLEDVPGTGGRGVVSPECEHQGPGGVCGVWDHGARVGL